MKRYLLTICCFISFYYCTAQINNPTLILPTGHLKAVTAVAYSPDGKTILTGSDDLSIMNWEASTGRELKVYNEATAPITTVKFSPDGNLFVAGCTDGKVLLFDFIVGKLLKTLDIHSDTVTSIDFFANDKFVSGSKDHSAKVYDISKDRIITTIHDKRFKINSVAYYSQGNFIITGGGGVNSSEQIAFEDPPTKLWNMQGDQEGIFAPGFWNITEDVHTVGFSADGQYAFAVSGWGGRVYDLLKKNKVKSKLSPISDFGALSPDKKLLLVGYANSIELLDLVTGKIVRKYKNTPLGMTSVAFSPDGHFLVVGLKNRAAVILDALTGENVTVLASRSGGVLAVTFSPYGKYLATGSLDGTAKIWDTEAGMLLSVLKGSKYPISSIAFSPDNKTIAAGNAGGNGIVYDIITAKPLYAFNGGAESVVYSPNGEKLLAINRDGMLYAVYLYSATGGKLIATLNRSIVAFGINHQNTCGVFSLDGKYIYIGGKTDYPLKRDNKIYKPFGEIWVWDGETGKYVSKFDENQGDIITCITISKDGTTLVTGSNDKDIFFWNRTLQKQTGGFNLHEDRITSVSYSPDEKTILSSSYDKTAKTLELADKTLSTFKGHTAQVFSAKFSPTGKYIVTGSLDNTTRLWSSTTGKEIASLIPIDINEWLIVTPDGYFDGSEKALQTLYYEYKSMTIPLVQLKPRYYRKGLLPILLGYQKGNLPPIAPFTSTEVYPLVKLNDDINPKNPILMVQLTNMGGGIGKVNLNINGVTSVVDTHPYIKAKSDILRIPIPLSASKHFIWGQKNVMSVTAYNADNTISCPVVSTSFLAAQKIK